MKFPVVPTPSPGFGYGSQARQVGQSPEGNDLISASLSPMNGGEGAFVPPSPSGKGPG